jgi:hypothetical protein
MLLHPAPVDNCVLTKKQNTFLPASQLWKILSHVQDAPSSLTGHQSSEEFVPETSSFLAVTSHD